MTSLRLAARGVLARLGPSVALFAVIVFAVASASAGAIYLRAAGESVLTDTLRAASPDVSGITVIGQVRSAVGLEQLTALLNAARAAVPGLEPTRAGIQTVGTTTDRVDVANASQPETVVAAVVAGRAGECAHLLIVRGRCVRPTPLDQPAEAVLSEQAARELHADPGTELLVPGFAAGSVPRAVRVVGIYRAAPDDPWWAGMDTFSTVLNATPASPEAVLLDFSAMEAALPSGMSLEARYSSPVDPNAIHLAQAAGIATAVSRYTAVISQQNLTLQIETNLPGLIGQAAAGRAALTVPVLLASLQLVALGLLILLVVAAMAAEARAGEVALAKLRGATAGQVFALAVLEIALITALAVPTGLAAGWAAAKVLAAVQLVPGVPVVVTPLAAAGALVAGAVALAAACVAGLGAVRRRVLDQWRQTRSVQGARRAAVAELLLLLVAVAALYNLRSGGLMHGATFDPLTLLAPTLAVLAGALVAVRALPAVARVGVAGTTGTRWLAGFLGTRQVARRSGAALRVVVALAAAFGLVTFALTVREAMLRNRDDRALTEVGAAGRYAATLPTGTSGLLLVRQADPAGDAVMAVLRDQTVLARSGATATVLGVDSRRYAAVGYWRGDFSPTPIPSLLSALGRTRSPGVGLGNAGAIRVAAATSDWHAGGALTLVGDVRDADGGLHQVRLGMVLPDRRQRYTAPLTAADGPAPRALVGLELDRGVAQFFEVRGSMQFTQVLARSPTGWAVVSRFADPAQWYSRNFDDYTPADILRPAPAGGGLVYSLQAPDTAPALGMLNVAIPPELPAVVTPTVAAEEQLRLGSTFVFSAPVEGEVRARVVGIAGVVPGSNTDAAILVDLQSLLGQLSRDPANGITVSANEVWSSGTPEATAALARLRSHGAVIQPVLFASEREQVFAHQAPSLALLLLSAGALAGALLATAGVMLHLFLSGRRRGFELAVLQALGARARDLWAPLAVEQGALIGYGVLGGGAIGVAAALVALPQIPEFTDNPTQPALLYSPDWPVLLTVFAAGAALVALGLAAVVAFLVRSARPALLREADR